LFYKLGYELGKGLDKFLQGIKKLITPYIIRGKEGFVSAETRIIIQITLKSGEEWTLDHFVRPA